MPSGTGVVDAFKNLIRHGKQHHNRDQPATKRTEPTANGSSASSRQHASSSSPASASSRSAPQSPPQSATPSPAATAPQPQQQQQQQQQQQVDNREVVEKLVRDEREAKERMPSYQGLENFQLLEKMGDGAFSNVYKALDLTTNKKVAIKVVRKFELNSTQQGDKHLNPKFKKKPRVTERANILKEVQIMRGTHHPSIVKLISFSEAPEHYHIVLELMEGGELFHQIVNLTYFSENLARHVILQVAHGIRYLHEERGVVHRDIKPENLLFERIPIIPSKNPVQRPYDEEKEDEGEFIPGVGGGGIGRVKIADFGLSKVVWDEQTMTPCGTVGYTAPEIVKDERYSKSVDMWALGCVLYTLLCGFPPFYDESINVLTEKVARGYFTFLSPWWDDISVTAKDLISHLLHVDPAQRYTIDEFLAHPWCNAAPAPPPPPTPFTYAQTPGLSGLSGNAPMDSPLLTAARGGRAEGKSPGLASLKEAFDITYAVHRMEEEGARRRKYNGRGGAGARGFLSGLNEDDEDQAEEDRMTVDNAKGGTAAARLSAREHQPSGSSSSSGRTSKRGPKGFELDMDGATLLGRRHKRTAVGVSSPLAGKATSAAPAEPLLDPGSPMRM